MSHSAVHHSEESARAFAVALAENRANTSSSSSSRDIEFDCNWNDLISGDELADILATGGPAPDPAKRKVILT